MKTITLAVGTTHVPFNDVAHLIAYAIYPDTDFDDDNLSIYDIAVSGLNTELKNAAKFGNLPVQNPLTLGAWANPIGNAFNQVLVAVADLRSFVADRGIQVIVETSTNEKASNFKPLQRTAAQEKAILAEIEKLGLNPKELTRNAPGKPGIKSTIREALSGSTLFIGVTVFDKAWSRMTKAGDIALK